MTATWWLTMCGYWAIMSVTPGPNNILLASSGLRFGLRPTLPQLVGITSGVVIQLIAVASGLGVVFATQPWLQLVLKILGSMYLAWLAWHSWMASGISDKNVSRPMGYWRAVGFQFINPKAWLGSLSVVTAFTIAGSHYMASMGAILVGAIVVGTPCGLVWALFGSTLRTWLGQSNRIVVVNRCFAVLTALTILVFWVPLHS